MGSEHEETGNKKLLTIDREILNAQFSVSYKPVYSKKKVCIYLTFLLKLVPSNLGFPYESFTPIRVG